MAALTAVNNARVPAGSGCATMVAEANTASERHCLYYSTNSGSCIANAHVEVSGCNNFYAAQFGARMQMAGYTGSPAFEDMAFSNNPNTAVRLWIDSIWHRTPIISPWVRHIGYGNAAGCDTMDFGTGPSNPTTMIVTYPYDLQTGVPRSFSGNEGPPPPAPPNGWPSGYPITIFIRNGNITEHTLVVDGTSQNIPHVWLDPASNNLLSNSAFVMYANSPLTAGTTYSVHFAGTQAGNAFTKDIKFTTQ